MGENENVRQMPEGMTAAKPVGKYAERLWKGVEEIARENLVRVHVVDRPGWGENTEEYLVFVIAPLATVGMNSRESAEFGFCLAMELTSLSESEVLYELDRSKWVVVSMFVPRPRNRNGEKQSFEEFVEEEEASAPTADGMIEPTEAEAETEQEARAMTEDTDRVNKMIEAGESCIGQMLADANKLSAHLLHELSVLRLQPSPTATEETRLERLVSVLKTSIEAIVRSRVDVHQALFLIGKAAHMIGRLED